MKIFLIPPPCLPVPAVQGGAVETLITHLIDENEQQGRVDLVCVSLPNEEAEQRSRSYRHTRMVYLPVSPFRQKLWGPVCGQLRRMNRPAPLDCWYNLVLRTVQAERPDVVVCEGGNLTEIQAISAETGRDNCWAHLHMQLKATPELEKLYGGVLAISQFVSDFYAPQCPVQQKLVPNCVDVQRFSPVPQAENECISLRARLGFCPEDFVVVYCGRICPQKGIQHLVQALKLVADPHVKLLVIGSPFFAAEASSPFFDTLKKQQAELDGRIVFTGFVDNACLPAYYRAADLACFPAVWDEPAGITAIEAMACGCPVLATESGGMPEYLAGSGAVLLPRHERICEDGTLQTISDTPPLPQSLAEAILSLKADPDRRSDMAAAGPVRAQAFSRQNYYKNYLSALGIHF